MLSKASHIIATIVALAISLVSFLALSQFLITGIAIGLETCAAADTYASLELSPNGSPESFAEMKENIKEEFSDSFFGNLILGDYAKFTTFGIVLELIFATSFFPLFLFRDSREMML